jgi:16S rRNA (cytosine1402-N4)-methyltransferase
VQEVIDYLRVNPEGVYLDLTFGRGGHTAALLDRLTTGRVIALDRDRSAIEAGHKHFVNESGKLQLMSEKFSSISEIVREPVQGILADLGISRDQIEDANRGFSFQRQGPLQMTMDTRQTLTAEEIVNHYDERQLADLIYQFGEERRSRRIARAIVRERPIRNTTHLAEVVEKAVPRAPFRRRYKSQIHPATRTFQAIRIAVNDELGEIEKLLETAPLMLAPKGRIAVISFHSLEDRAVKHSFRQWNAQGVLEVLTRRVVRPSVEEIADNPASRSAKLRAAERTELEWPQ